MTSGRSALALTLLIGVAGCGGGPMPAAAFGEQLFSDPRLSESSGNSVSCATCHSAEATEPSDRILPGHSLYDSAFRSSYWNGQELRLLDAINVCFTVFMRGYPPLDAEDPKAKALYEFLLERSPTKPSPALPLTIVKNIVGDLPRGPRSEGERVYRASCRGCHGDLHTGAGRISESAVTLPEATEVYGELFPGVPPSIVVIEKVRHGAFFGIGGTMPPYGLERLTDEELGALLTYLEL
jgi:thiosulfate dehydrogenase